MHGAYTAYIRLVVCTLTVANARSTHKSALPTQSLLQKQHKIDRNPAIQTTAHTKKRLTLSIAHSTMNVFRTNRQRSSLLKKHACLPVVILTMKRSSQTGQHKPHSASRSICLTPPRTEVALHTQQHQAIQFHSTKLNRFPQRTNAQLCHATRRNTAHAQTENCPHKTVYDAPHSASSQ